MTPDYIDSYEHVTAPVHVVALDPDGVPRYVGSNAAAGELWDVRREDLIGKSALEVFPGPSGHTAYERQKQTLGEGIATSYATTCAKGDTVRSVSTDLRPVRNPSGQVTHAVGTCTDMTIHVEVERLRTSLENATTQVEHFVFLAAHDLRTPMRNVQILTDMLREGFHDRGDGKVELINLLDEVAAKSACMISDVLAYSQSVVTGSEILTFNLKELCTGIGNVIDPQEKHRFEAPDIMLRADRLMVQIILRNLIDNAIKHGGRDRMSVEISVTPAEPGVIRLTVIDDGVGFSNPGKVFVDTGNYRAECGYGLLGIRRLLTTRGGKMSVEQREGKPGGAVVVTMPGRVQAPFTATGFLGAISL